MRLQNIVFDLFGVVIYRNHRKCRKELLDFLSFIAEKNTPHFWDEYDRGTISMNEALDELAKYRNCNRQFCDCMIEEAIVTQEEIAETKQLITDLKAAGYKLYVLSNMSKEFIGYLRKLPVYKEFDGEVVSCELGAIKPEPLIFETLLSKYSLDASETMFIDDRQTNLNGALPFGIQTFLFNCQNPENSCSKLRSILLQ